MSRHTQVGYQQVVSFVAYQRYQFSGIHAGIARYITFGEHRLYHIQCYDVIVYGHHAVIAFRIYLPDFIIASPILKFKPIVRFNQIRNFFFLFG